MNQNTYITAAKEPTSGGNVIPVFFATDDAYAPYLAVAIRSLAEHAAEGDEYRIYILISSLSAVHRRRLSALARKGIHVEFVSVEEKLDGLGALLHLRDYYTKATYYRFFIPALFPQYAKGIYLDCDVVLLSDLGELWRMPLGNRMLAAAPEEVMQRVDVFGRYAETVLGVPREEYFSAGVMLMNLDRMRKERLEEQFVALLRERTFSVTQDQDYLNVLCHGKAALFPLDWNKTAGPFAEGAEEPKLVHYKINWKPWHYRGVRLEEAFWKYAEKTAYHEDLKETLRSYTDRQRAEDNRQYCALVSLAERDIAACCGR